MDKANDNILQDDLINTREKIDQAADDYMKRFESVDTQCTKLREIALLLKKQPDQDHRLLKALNFIEQQQKWNEDIYELLVEMNNFFAPK